FPPASGWGSGRLVTPDNTFYLFLGSGTPGIGFAEFRSISSRTTMARGRLVPGGPWGASFLAQPPITNNIISTVVQRNNMASSPLAQESIKALDDISVTNPSQCQQHVKPLSVPVGDVGQ